MSNQSLEPHEDRMPAWLWVLLMSVVIYLVVGAFVDYLESPSSETTVQFEWEPAYEWEDGTLMQYNDVSHFVLYCDHMPPMIVRPTPTNSIWTVLPPGSHTCTITSVSAEGVESKHSNKVAFLVGEQE